MGGWKEGEDWGEEGRRGHLHGRPPLRKQWQVPGTRRLAGHSARLLTHAVVRTLRTTQGSGGPTWRMRKPRSAGRSHLLRVAQIKKVEPG